MATHQIINGLKVIHAFKGVHVEDEVVKRRSSVALIIRFPGLDIPDGASLEDFLEMVEAKESGLSATSAEVLFIKRTSRVGDNWSGHVALPGGKRDPEDESDLMTAVRETAEEIGLELMPSVATPEARPSLYVGPLDQRLVKTSWGRVTLMTLCSFVFIVSGGAKSPKLTLQPSEIDRTFWIPVPHLYGKEAGTAGYEVVNVGHRLRLHNNPLIPKFLHPFISTFMVGNMLFGCTDLKDPRDMVITVPGGPKPPYKLWGLTLGVIIDFLELIRPRTEAVHFRFPTMQAPDLRLILYIMSRRFRNEKMKELRSIEAHEEGQMDLAGRALTGYFGYIAKTIYVGVSLRLFIVSLASYKLFCLLRK